MLRCGIDLKNISDSELACGKCQICSGESKDNYQFEKDLKGSEKLVDELIDYVQSRTRFVCEKTKINKNPDINVYKDSDCKELVCRIEAKYLGGQAFMKAKRFINLYPKEALVVDYPKLQSYIECKDNDRNGGKEIPVYVVWKFNRPCANIGGSVVYQEVDELSRILRLYQYARTFQRKTAPNDFDEGIRLGIIDKYHFSLRECKPIESLIEEILLSNR